MDNWVWLRLRDAFPNIDRGKLQSSFRPCAQSLCGTRTARFPSTISLEPEPTPDFGAIMIKVGMQIDPYSRVELTNRPVMEYEEERGRGGEEEAQDECRSDSCAEGCVLQL